MIGGFPHRQEDSFFHHALERLQKETRQVIASSLFTLGGFPITRVPKHMDHRCLAAQPDIVVVQFGASDLIVPLRRKHNHHGGGISAAQRKVSASPPTLANRLRWHLNSFVGDALRLTPVTPPAVYLETMSRIARTFLEHEVVPVILSPFVFGGPRSDRIARDCAGRMQQALATLPRAVYVDAYSALNRHPRSRMLLCDGTHLSLAGHRMVADVLFPRLKSLVENQAWFLEKSSVPEK